MSESQATVRLTGPLEEPQRTVSLRAGEARWTVKGRQARQIARALPPDPAMAEAAESLAAEALAKLDRFHGLEATVDIYGLTRERRVDTAGEAPQRFRGFWGALDAPGAWRSVFGLAADGAIAFRRGVWEDWPTDLPRMDGVGPALPMIFSPYCATLFHETVGHALEAEYLADSPLKFRVGERIAPRALTVMDRPDLAGFAGSMARDDAGLPATATTLVHQGFLVGDLGHESGALRRGSFRDEPQVRATNFLVAKGGGDPALWLREFSECFYVSWIQSGNWRPGLQRIKALTGPVFRLRRGEPVAWTPWTVLRFSIFDLLAGILEVGDDLCMDPATHWCVKKNQPAPIGMGSPSILMRGLSP